MGQEKTCLCEQDCTSEKTCLCGHDCTSVEAETFTNLTKCAVDIDYIGGDRYEVTFSSRGNGTGLKLGKSVVIQLREALAKLQL